MKENSPECSAGNVGRVLSYPDLEKDEETKMFVLYAEYVREIRHYLVENFKKKLENNTFLNAIIYT